MIRRVNTLLASSKEESSTCFEIYSNKASSTLKKPIHTFVNLYCVAFFKDPPKVTSNLVVTIFERSRAEALRDESSQPTKKKSIARICHLYLF